MLLVVFSIGGDRFGLDSREVVEILPLVEFRKLPRAPEYVCGLFQYRGKIVPAIDLARLAGTRESHGFLSTRILLVRYPDEAGENRFLGLVAEQVTETVKVDERGFSSPGIHVKDAPYLGEITRDSRGIVQRIEIGQLLSPDVREVLFQPAEASA